MPTLPDLLDSVEAIIFDWDGTLVDSHTAHYQAFCEALALDGISVDHSWFMSTTGLSTEDTVRRLAQEMDIRLTTSVEDIVSRCERMYLNHLDLVQEIPWVVDIARAWHGCKPLAVASGGPAHNIAYTMHMLGMQGLFDTVVSRDDVSAGKPSPEIFLLAADRIGVDASRCLVLEDSEEGIRAAQSAGASVVDIRSGHIITHHALKE